MAPAHAAERAKVVGPVWSTKLGLPLRRHTRTIERGAMRYRMKQRVFSIAQSFTVEDEEGHPAFIIGGKVMSLGHQFAFRDVAATDLAHIKQKIVLSRATYEIYRDGKLAAVVEGVPLEHL